MVTPDHQALVVDRTLELLLERCDERPVVVSTDSIGTFALTRSPWVERCEVLEVGIREASAVAIALGAASAGVPVLVTAFAAFGLRRGFESLVVHAEPPLRSAVMILGGLPGLSAARDGVSHHSLDDFSIARAVGRMRVAVPCCASSIDSVVDDSLRCGGVSYLRAYRGLAPVDGCGCNGRGHVVHQQGDGDRVVVAYGPIAWELRRHAPRRVGVIEVSDVLDLSPRLLEELRRRAHVIVVDEHQRDGSLGARLSTLLPGHHLTTLAVDRDPGSGNYDELLAACGIDPSTAIRVAMGAGGGRDGV